MNKQYYLVIKTMFSIHYVGEDGILYSDAINAKKFKSRSLAHDFFKEHKQEDWDDYIIAEL